MADTNWMDEFAVTGGKTKGVTSTPKHGSPMPLDTSTKNWMDEFAVTSKVEGKSTKKKTQYVSSAPDDMLTKIFRPVNQYMRSLPLGLDSMEKKIGPSVVKGIPIAGRMVPQTEQLTQFEEENPGWSKALQTMGGVAATLPLSVGVAGQASAKFLPQALNQGMLGTTLATGDVLAEKGLDTTEEDFLTNTAGGFAGGFGGATLGRMITPSVPMNRLQAKMARKPASKEPNLSKLDKLHIAHSGDPGVEASNRLLLEALSKGKSAPQTNISPTTEKATQALLRAAMGGAISHLGGLGPVPGILIGGASPYIGPSAKNLTDKWAKNKLLNRPTLPKEMYPPGFANTTPSQLPRHILHALGIDAAQ